MPLSTSESSTTEQPTTEFTRSPRQASSLANHSKSEHRGEQKLVISTPTKETSESPLDNINIGTTLAGASSVTSTAIYQPTSSGLSTPHREGLSNELLAGGIAGGLTALILIGLLLLAVIKRRKTRGLVLAQSNTETSFDNLGFTGGRKISEYMDLSEFELVRVKVGNSVKRKISAFTKEDQKTQRVSCGRLDLVEVPANTEIDSDVLLTTWV